MDVETAINHRRRLQSELVTIRGCALLIPISRKLLAIEIARLDHKIPSEYMSSVTDVSKIKIPVENRLPLLQLSVDFDLSGVESLRDFIRKLDIEIRQIQNFYSIGQLPLTIQFGCRVITILQDEIIRQQGTELLSSEGLVRSAGMQEYVERTINEAIDYVLRDDPEGATVYHVLGLVVPLLPKENIRNLVHQRFFEATFPLKSKPPPKQEVLLGRRSHQ